MTKKKIFSIAVGWKTLAKLNKMCEYESRTVSNMIEYISTKEIKRFDSEQEKMRINQARFDEDVLL